MKNISVGDAGLDPLGRFLPPHADARLISHYLAMLAESEARLRSGLAEKSRPARPASALTEQIAELERQLVSLREQKGRALLESQKEPDGFSPQEIDEKVPVPDHWDTAYLTGRSGNTFVYFNKQSGSSERVLRWNKHPGDIVLKGEFLAEIGKYRIFIPVAGILLWTAGKDRKLVVSAGEHLATIKPHNTLVVRMPGVPNSILEIRQWLKAPGNAVSKGEVIGYAGGFLIEALGDGVLASIHYPVGGRVSVGTEIALIRF